MPSMKLLELIETHADALTQQALKDLATNSRTRAFHLVPRGELEARVFAAYDNLGTWIGNPSDEAIRYHLARGYEAEATRRPRAASA